MYYTVLGHLHGHFLRRKKTAASAASITFTAPGLPSTALADLLGGAVTNEPPLDNFVIYRHALSLLHSIVGVAPEQFPELLFFAALSS